MPSLPVAVPFIPHSCGSSIASRRHGSATSCKHGSAAASRSRRGRSHRWSRVKEGWIQKRMEKRTHPCEQKRKSRISTMASGSPCPPAGDDGGWGGTGSTPMRSARDVGGSPIVRSCRGARKEHALKLPLVARTARRGGAGTTAPRSRRRNCLPRFNYSLGCREWRSG